MDFSYHLQIAVTFHFIQRLSQITSRKFRNLHLVTRIWGQRRANVGMLRQYMHLSARGWVRQYTNKTPADQKLMFMKAAKSLVSYILPSSSLPPPAEFLLLNVKNHADISRRSHLRVRKESDGIFSISPKLQNRVVLLFH